MNLTDRTEIDALKARVDLVALIQQSGIPLEKMGRQFSARCPFHEDGQASLVVNPERGLWQCFGCESGGDAITFLELREGLRFPEAMERLRALAGEFPAPTGNGPPNESPKGLPGGYSRAELLGRVAELYAERLRSSKKALDYLAGRGLADRELLAAFRVGFADGSLLDTLPEEGDLHEALRALGVLNEKGREHFRGCVVVPLEHPDEGVVSLYGRRIAARTQVRHLHLPGPQRGVLNWQVLRTASSIVAAEGVLDALSLWAAGVREATALFGTRDLPPDLDQLLGRFGVREVRLCLDADAAGAEAAERLAGQLGRRGIRCLRVELPGGQDPNDVLQAEGASALRTAVERAKVIAVPSKGAPGNGRPEGPRLEAIPDGFRLHFDQVVYRVTPRPPFTGRLRVTLRARRAERLFLDTLDLYSHRARAGAVNQVVKRLELERLDVERHFLALLEQAERHVATLVDESADEVELGGGEPPEMTEEERASALAFLKRPDLVEALLEDMEALGTVGEEKGKLLAYLVGVSRKLEKPLSGILLSQSGAGKSGLATLVEQLTPPEELVLYSRLSAQALCYLPKDFLRHKLLILEERVGAEAADYSIRVLQSRARFSQAIVEKNPATGRMRTRQNEVEGPIAFLETTTTSSRDLNHENTTRCFEIGLDETEEQTRRIHQRQRQARRPEGYRSRGRTEAIRRRHHHAQRLLEPLPVLIPYAHLLRFPSRWLRTRRDNERFLCLVEASAFLHQHQRARGELVEDGQGLPYVEASAADYRLAYELAREVLRTTLHELSRPARDLWALRASCEGGGDDDSEGAGGETFTRRELRRETGWPDRRLRDAIQELVEMEYFEVASGGPGRIYRYRLAESTEAGGLPLHELTSPEELERLLEGGEAPAEP